MLLALPGGELPHRQRIFKRRRPDIFE